MRKIEVNDETFKFLMRTYGVSNVTVWRALSYKSNSDVAQAIRSLAVQKGGVRWNRASDQMDTIHDSEGKMIQTWGGRVVLEADKTTGRVRVLIDGEEKEVHEHVSVAQLMKMQQRMAVWAAKL